MTMPRLMRRCWRRRAAEVSGGVKAGLLTCTTFIEQYRVAFSASPYEAHSPASGRCGLVSVMTATAHIDSSLSERFVTEPFDTLSRLDHHTRSQAIPPDDAPPGRYLELDGPH